MDEGNRMIAMAAEMADGMSAPRVRETRTFGLSENRLKGQLQCRERTWGEGYQMHSGK